MTADMYDALVIGAGFAGLTAARDLTKNGHRVLLIEARDRIGGRTWYRPFADTPHLIEMGGGWVDTHNTAIMKEIKRYDIRLAETPVPESFVSVLGGERHFSPLPLSAEDVLGLERGIFRILTDAHRFDPNIALDLQDAVDLDVPLEAYLDALELPYNVRQLMGAWNRANTGCEESDVSALHPLSWFESLGGSVLAHWQFPSHTFAHGTASLAQVLLQDAACDISLSSPVDLVTHTAADVEVTTHGGDRFRGRAAVIAVPLNCWSDIEFAPALSTAKQFGAQVGHAGSTQKLWALATGLPNKLQGLGERDAPIDVLSAQYQLEDGDLVVGFSTRERGLDVTDPAAVQAALRVYAPEARVKKVDSHDWLADPYAKGVWCAPRPGTLSKHASTLAAGEGRLLFAGSDLEQAFRGWMSGAIESGGTAASRVSELLAAT